MSNKNYDLVQWEKDSHCSYCGSRFTEQVEWPRMCFTCYNKSYKPGAVCHCINSDHDPEAAQHEGK